MDFPEKVHVSSSGEHFNWLGMLAVVSRKKEQGLVAAGAIGKIAPIDMQNIHADQKDSIALR